MNILSDFYCYVNYKNRPDLLVKAVASIQDFHSILTVVDNSPEGLPGNRIRTFRPPVPMTFTQTHNWWFNDAKERGSKFIIWIHGDAEAVDGGHLKLLNLAREMEGKKWYTIWTNYDSLAAVNLAAIDEVGGYDTHIEKYLCDNDLTYRMKLAGWDAIDTGINTIHHGSTTIKSDMQLCYLNDIVHGLDRQYYIRKWGGMPGFEKFTSPFDRPDLFPDLKPVGVW